MGQLDQVVKQGNKTRNSTSNKSQATRSSFALQLLTLSCLVFVFALIGIWSRPIGALASLWPANALLVACLARMGLSRSVLAYAFAWASFVAADVITGSSFAVASLLTLGNLMSVGAGLIYLHLSTRGRIDLSDRTSIFHIIMLAFIASNAGGVLGMYAGPQIFGNTLLEGYLFWAVTEFVNYIAFLPVLFAMPATRMEWVRYSQRKITWSRALPALVTFLLTVVVINLSYINALALPLLGLLWCAFVYSTFSMALLTLFYCLQALLIVSASFSPVGDDLASWIDLMLVRVSISAVALVPIVVSIYTQTTRSDVENLSYSANHDCLTGALTRSAFLDVLQRMLVDAEGRKRVTLFMMDLDHFKSINDRYGHAVGDAAIVHFLNVVQQCLRAGDAVGRIGGEEFAVAIVQKDQIEPSDIASRIHRALAELPLTLEDGGQVPFTVSIGATSLQRPVAADEIGQVVAVLLKQSDDAMYQAKANGRNQTRFYLR